jgi:hypothetical protein
MVRTSGASLPRTRSRATSGRSSRTTWGRYAILAIAGVTVLAGTVQAAGAQGESTSKVDVSPLSDAASPFPQETLTPSTWKPLSYVGTDSGVSAGAAMGESKEHRTLPLWEAKDKKFRYTMVGTDPYVAEGTAGSTKIKAEIFPLVVTFEDTGDVFDPTVPDSNCSPAGSAVDLTLQSPLLQSSALAPGGTNIGSGEYPTYLFQRASFFDQTSSKHAVNPDYGVTLEAVTEPAIDISVPPTEGETADVGCDRLGLINADDWDLSGLVANLKTEIQPGVLPIFLLYNVVFFIGTPNDCCALGYHAALDNPSYHGALQTYVMADFDASGLFTGSSDITNLSEDIGDWMDNPTGQNRTKPWENLGQAQGCQATLEVGGPLAGTDFPVTMPNGYTYHPEELVFKSWFYGNKKSSAVNGWYSFNGTLTMAAAHCS